jgi:hypothetical protein
MVSDRPPPAGHFHKIQNNHRPKLEKTQMGLYFPAFVQATRNPHVASHLDDFVRGFSSAFEMRFFSFSSYTSSIFFDPTTSEYAALTNAIYTVYEQSAIVDLFDSVMVSVEDVTSRKMPVWAKDDVMSYAQHFTRSSGVSYSPFVGSLQHRFFANLDVQKLLAASPRGTSSANEMRNVLYAFASVALLSRALTQASSPVDPAQTPMLAVYLQRVLERYHAEANIEFELNFNGPANPAWFMDSQTMYDPVRPCTKEVKNSLNKVVVAAYRALTCSTVPAREILTWTQLVLNSFHTHPDSMWAVSRTTVAVRTTTTPTTVAKATTTTPPTTVAVVAAAPPQNVFAPKTPKTPKTPHTPRTPKNSLRFETALDNF